MPPRSHDWTERLTDGFLIKVTYTALEGKLVGFSVVLIKDDGTNVYDISRYDTAHGFAHRDVLGRKTGSSSIGKISYNHMPLIDAFRYARADFKANYTKYDEDYEKH